MTGFLLLAAGSASRMGKPKMLFSFNGKTFLQHAIDEISGISKSKLVVVTGCYHRLTEEILRSQKIDFKENKQWTEGMGSSVSTGVEYMTRQYSDVQHIIVVACDQPHISTALFAEMITQKANSGKGIVASGYNGTTGIPVLFDAKYFDQLILLNGPAGARHILRAHCDDLSVVPFPGGAVDIDTIQDYENLLLKKSGF